MRTLCLAFIYSLPLDPILVGLTAGVATAIYTYFSDIDYY